MMQCSYPEEKALKIRKWKKFGDGQEQENKRFINGPFYFIDIQWIKPFIEC